MIKDLILTFTKLGLSAFGGPAAHIAMMRQEVVEKRKWLEDEEFLNLMGFTNLIPGPNSTEMAIMIGWRKAGTLGLFVSGISFIFPAMVMVIIIGFLYRQYGDLPQVTTLFDTLKPVVSAIIVVAFIKLVRPALPHWKQLTVLFVAIAMSYLGLSELLVLILSGCLYLLLTRFPKQLMVEPISLIGLFLLFLKIGSMLFGSGYVLVAFLESELVTSLNLMSYDLLIDAIAVGEITPGPVLTTATFIGYQLHGLAGSIVATIGIFAPSFILVLLLGPVFSKMSQNKVFSIVLRGVALGSLALMALVSWRLSVTTLNSLLTWILFLVTMVGLLKTKMSAIVFIGLGLIVGVIQMIL